MQTHRLSQYGTVDQFRCGVRMQEPKLHSYPGSKGSDAL